MAIRKLDRSFAPVAKEIKYLNKSFPQWRQSLIDFAKMYFPDTYTDFNESSPGMMFIEMASYVGDVLSYYIDTQFRENLMQFAEEQDNIISIAQSMGYKPKPATASNTDADFYQLCPALDFTHNFAPDTRFLLRLDSNAVVSATEFGTVNFRVTGELNFADPFDREITVYSVNGSNEPTMYLIRKRAKIVSGEIKTMQVSIGAPQKFTRISVPDTNVLEILNVKDSSGFTWYEVDYLAQDLIIDGTQNVNPAVNSSQGVPPTYMIRLKRTPRRFVTRYNADYNMELHFGSGILDDDDSTINLEPNKIANSEYQNNIASTTLDPSDFLSSRSYGLAPGNITLTIIYVTGGGLESNVPSNTVNKVSSYTVLNDRSIFSPTENNLFTDIITTLAVNNPFPGIGGKGQDSVEEIRQNALAFFNSQNRAVSVDDYTVRAYAMPPKFGGVAKAFVASDDQLNNIMNATIDQISGAQGDLVVERAGKNIVNLYVLGYDQNKKLVKLNDDVKKNLRTYVDQYRLLTDEVRILDAFVVNIGVDFSIVVFKSHNMNEVLVRCIDAVKNFFDIERWQINQPIILADLINEIATVEGVQSVNSVKVFNRYRFKDGGDYNDFIYDIENTALHDGVIYPSLDPCVFEIRYPENDIIGTSYQ
jgi:hypothetical protein